MPSLFLIVCYEPLLTHTFHEQPMANYSTENAGIVLATTRSAYDLQKLRIQTGNRIVANFRDKLGMDAGEPDDDAAQELMADLRKRYRRITDGIARVTRRPSYDYDGVITTYAEIALLDYYFSLAKREQSLFTALGDALKKCPIWNEFLDDVHGVGPAMGGVIVSEMDPHRAKHPSSFWSYAGLDVADDGRGRSRREAHLVEHTYTDSEGNEQTRKGISFNPFLKTKLIGVLGPSFLRARSDDAYYQDVYYRYRHRIENRDDLQDESDGHLHNMAIRYMVKDFLIDLHIIWRDLEDLPVSKPYHVAKLGKDDHDRERRLGVHNPKRHGD